jgi:hypothetical protein
METGQHGSTLPDAEQVRHALLPSGWRGKPLPKTTLAGQSSHPLLETLEILARKVSRAYCLFSGNTVFSITTTDPLEKSSLPTEAE